MPSLIFVLFSFLSLIPGSAYGQAPLPSRVAHFPETLGPHANPAFYRECLPMYSSFNPANVLTGNHDKLFILTLNTFQAPKGVDHSDSLTKIFPSQALLFGAGKEGVFPRWQMNFKDDTGSTQESVLGIFRYYPEFGVYTLVRNEEVRGHGTTLQILDSTFHTLTIIPGAVPNAHDFQLLKTTEGNWQVISMLRGHPSYFHPDDQNYAIASSVYDRNNTAKLQWVCGPTTSTVDSAEWINTYNNCPANPNRHIKAHDMFHPNSWEVFPWSKDSLLLAVSEKMDNKVRFWWIVDSAGTWVTRKMFRLGSYNHGFFTEDRFNDFLFPAESRFQIEGGHNFRMLGRSGNNIIASYFDDEDCDVSMPARGLILSMDMVDKTAFLLQQTVQGSYASGRGSMQVMLDRKTPVTNSTVLNADRCVAWGGYGRMSANVPHSYFPSDDTTKRQWELSVVNSNNQTIAGITITDEGPYSGYKVLNNTEYQAEAFYRLPIPSRPITYKLTHDGVNLTTGFVHPTWLTGETTNSITIPLSKVQEIKRMWVRGKTDETMAGELWEHIELSDILKSGRK